MSKKTYHKTAAFILIFALGMSTLSGCAKASKTPDLITPASESLQGVEAKKTDVKKTVVFTGYVTGTEKGYYFKENKNNLEYKVSLGDKVSKGQALVVADGSELEDELESLQLQLTSAKAEATYQKEYGKLNKNKLEVQKKNAAASEKEMAENELEKAEIDQQYQEALLALQISSVEKQIEEIKKEMEENTLYADKEGYVSYLGFENYAMEFANVAVVMDTNDLHIALKNDMSKDQAEKYQRAYINYDGSEIELSEIAYSEAEKKVAQKSAMVLAPKFKLANNKMKLGEYVAVHIVMEESENAIAVPKTCIYESENGDYVYRIKGENKEKCYVETGIQGNVETQIKSGIQEGDLIYYPVDEKVKYKTEEKVKKDTIAIKNIEEKCRLMYPRYRDVKTGVGEATLDFVTSEKQIKKGDLVATISLTAGAADVKDVENQIASLNKQFTSQKTMHEKTIKLLNKEINALSKKSGSSSAVVKNQIQNDKEVSLMGNEETSETTQGDTSQGSTTEIENAKKSTEATTEEKKEENKDGDGSSTQTSETEGEEQPAYPIAVQLALKKLELSMEKLTKTYDKENYDRQIKSLNKSLETLKKKTGKINLYAPCDGELYSGFDESYIGRLIAEDSSVVTIKDEEFSFIGISNSDNQVKFGESVIVKDDAGKEHSGTIVGAYPSGQINVTESDSDGMYVSYYAEPTENQKSAYVKLDDGSKLEGGTISVRSNEVKNAITISKDAIKRDGDYNYVWILSQGKPYKQYIEYIMVADDKAWVFEGLSEDDTLLMGVK